MGRSPARLVSGPITGPALALGVALCLAAVSTPARAQMTWLKGAGPPYQRLIEHVADRYSLDAMLLSALVEVESARQADAVSPKGAKGLGQLMPGTAKRFGVQDIHNPRENLDGAAKYLSFLIQRYNGDLQLALAAYNAGEQAVDRHGGIPDFPETMAFVSRVLDRAGLSHHTRARKPGDPEPVRVVRGSDGKLLLTNVY